MARQKDDAVRVLIEGSFTTSKSLEFFRRNRGKLGEVVSASCEKRSPISSDPPYLTVKGKDALMELTGCGCGYAGTGAHGTASVLQELGVPADDALRLMQQEAFEVLFDCRK